MIPDRSFDIVREDDTDPEAARQRLDQRDLSENLHDLQHSARLFKPGRHC